MTDEATAARNALIVLLKARRRKMTASERGRRKKPVRWIYPWAVEHHYGAAYRAWVRPVREYVHEYIKKHHEAILQGDSAGQVVRRDAVAGKSFKLMVESCDNWISAYVPEGDDGKAQSTIYRGLGSIADSAFDFNGSQYDKSVKSVQVEFPSDESWWPEARRMWQDTNYDIVRNDLRKYVSDINAATEQAVTNGWSVKILSEKIQGLDDKISRGRANFIARDQIGKLNGTVTQKRMQDIGLSMYVWSTSGDERVRESHSVMEGLLCRWDDASVYSEDGGKTWQPRPAGAVLMHPGMDYQCRCCALAWFNELIDEADAADGIVPDYGPEETAVTSEEIGVPQPVHSLDDFKTMKTPLPLEKALKQTNPNYGKGFGWENNCQRCCPTYEAIRRGYDVIAKPTPAKNKTELNSDKFSDYNKNGFAMMYKNADVINAKGVGKNEIKKSMKEWGDGSRCEICVVWKDNGGGHVFMAEQVDGKVLFLDPQSNKVYDESVFDKAKKTYTKYFRVDDLDFNDNIIDCCLNRKEKRK